MDIPYSPQNSQKPRKGIYEFLNLNRLHKLENIITIAEGHGHLPRQSAEVR